MYAFEYHRPTSLADAAEALSAGNEDARSLAGGQTLIPTLKRGWRSRPTWSTWRNRGAAGHPRGGRRSGDRRHHDAWREVAGSEVVRRVIPTLAELANGIGDDAGAQPRHDGRVDGEQRPVGGLSRWR